MDTKLKKFTVWQKIVYPEQIFCKYFLAFNPMRLGLSGPHDQFHHCYSATYRPVMLKSSWLLIFIFKTYFEKIFEKLNINQVAAVIFFEMSEKFWKKRNFFWLEIAEIDTGGQFWVERNIPRHKKTHFLEFTPISRV